MPTWIREDDKPVVTFDPTVEISPFVLFRRLDEGREVVLVDVRAEPGERTLEGARRAGDATWEPPEGVDVVLFDDDGDEAVAAARELQGRGFERVRALFGGLDLYEFSLDPEVVGERTFLVRQGRGL